MNIQEARKFLDKIFSEIELLGIDTAQLTLDHIAYQTSSSKDYENRKEAFLELSKLISEEIVGNRRVGIFRLNQSLTYNKNSINIIETIEPKTSQNPPSGWEHVEFTIDLDLEDFMSLYPNLDWNTSKLNRDHFPMLILKLSKNLQVKFPRRGVIQETKRISSKNK
jgi:predicted metalloenzyme YecM